MLLDNYKEFYLTKDIDNDEKVEIIKGIFDREIKTDVKMPKHENHFEKLKIPFQESPTSNGSIKSEKKLIKSDSKNIIKPQINIRADDILDVNGFVHPPSFERFMLQRSLYINGRV